METAVMPIETAGGNPLRFVGHSLGGGLATTAALLNNRPATTFNAAGVHAKTLGMWGNLSGAPDLIDAYRVQGEILSTVQDSGLSLATAGLVGLIAPNGNGKEYWLPGTSVDPISRHFMGDVLKGMSKLLSS